MYDFEKLGAFYLGKRIDQATGDQSDDLVLYDSKDLTTHAVIIGMTGSGKTGLGVGMLEEAALDHVPVIAIDPKGDLANLLLTFPKLRGEDFKPWVNARAAADQGQSVDEYATAQAALWKKGLAKWGQDGKRIKALKDAADFAVYTPGSNAGLPISVLQSFDAPDPGLLDDSDLYRERVQATATGILSLLGINADPISSREHILLSQILDHAWVAGKSLDLAALISAIQDPPIVRVGVMDLESFYPSKDRFALAMRLNNLLAAPGFASWMQGEPLKTQRLLYTDSGKPRVSVMSIAHLDEDQRMFFVTMLLNDLIAWMRAQQGTSSLRAILYMDEIFGYMPPTANPPAKRLFLTLLKQARAYGVGLVLATQNPVDLDYKGLSNTGTWFIGRLQTERDKARMMDGLEGVTSGKPFDRPAMERTLAGLGKRRFLLHNVHEDEDVIFSTRWVMSYLAGPMTRDHIRALSARHKKQAEKAAKAANKTPKRQKKPAPETPVLPPAIQQCYLRAQPGEIVYYPRVMAAAELFFSSARYHVELEREKIFTVEAADGPVPIDWDDAVSIAAPIDALESSAEPGSRFANCPQSLTNAKSYGKWERAFKTWVRKTETVTLYRSAKHKLTSNAGETEGEFRTRLQQVLSEKRDLAIAKIRKRYASKTTTLENRLLRAEQKIESEEQQSTQRKLDTVVSFGTAILGAVLGRKRLSSSTASKVGTAVRRASAARKKSGDLSRAKETAEKVKLDLEALNEALQAEVDELESSFDAQAEELREVVIKPKATDVHVAVFGVVWMPYRDGGDGRLTKAWTDV
ncbi:MAG: DUF87 domain-containing protein [Pseudomonadota bacterium]